MLENFMNMLNSFSKQDMSIHINSKDFNEAIGGEVVPIKLDGFSTLTVELLKLFTNDKKYYKDFYTELIEKNNASITIKANDSQDNIKHYEFNKFKIIDALDWANDNNKLNQEEIEKLKLIKMSAGFCQFIKKYQDRTSGCNIEGEYYALPVKEFIDFMEEKPENVIQIIKNGKYHDLELDKFIYALDVFLDENKILDKYYIPDNVVNNLNKMRNEIDITYLNRCLDNDYSYLRKVEINSEFKKDVLANMNSDFDDLEKAFFIYYKMCYLLTYDEEQYARREDKDYEIKHHDFSRLKNINSNNNKIVCYEFNALYAKFLRDLGFKYELVGSNQYGQGHSSLTFRVGKFIVTADSTASLIKSDLAYAKNGLVLTGFKLENNNLKTYEEFATKIDNVYDYIIDNIGNKYVGTAYSLKKAKYKIPSNLDLEEKTNLFINMSNESTLPTIDKIPYELMLRKILFNRENKDIERFNINYISNREKDPTEKYTTIKLITYNENGVEDINSNNYVAINSNKDIEYLDYNLVKERLENNIFQQAKTNKRTIPGFNLDEMYGNFINKNKSKIKRIR